MMTSAVVSYGPRRISLVTRKQRRTTPAAQLGGGLYGRYDQLKGVRVRHPTPSIDLVEIAGGDTSR